MGLEILQVLRLLFDLISHKGRKCYVLKWLFHVISGQKMKIIHWKISTQLLLDISGKKIHVLLPAWIKVHKHPECLFTCSRQEKAASRYFLAFFVHADNMRLKMAFGESGSAAKFPLWHDIQSEDNAQSTASFPCNISTHFPVKHHFSQQCNNERYSVQAWCPFIPSAWSPIVNPPKWEDNSCTRSSHVQVELWKSEWNIYSRSIISSEITLHNILEKIKVTVITIKLN